MPEVKERGCGRRQKGACYLTVPVAEKGQGTPLDTFLLCPPRPVDAEALRLSPMGVRLHELGGITHVFDWVGASHYKNVADVIAESRRSGVSRRISRMSDFSRLGPGSCLLLLHERALIENAADYWSELRNEARELLPPHADIWQPRHRCPKKLWEHVNIPMEPPMPAEMCQALYWEDVEGGDVVLDPAVPWRSVDRTVGSTTQATAVAIQALSFTIGMASIGLVFMRLADRVNQRALFIASAIIQVVGMALLALFPLTVPLALLYVFLMQFGGGFGAQSFFQLWSAEAFPTLLRSTAQGMCFAIVRISLGVFSFFVPALSAVGFTRLAWILPGFLVASGLIGALWAPRNQGKSLEQIEAERVREL